MKDSRAILESDLDKFLMGYCANNLEEDLESAVQIYIVANVVYAKEVRFNISIMIIESYF